ncbi:TetR/AcrR family transcriptional regulator [Kribbella shirazensis]|jgi:AcrR family transcriptional regulator|uniref:AcrR family transcriptional regulator n=1 Tax=Kribbella shirazensis TaxID=1105143 RepID=A0A7X5VC13_9ACTN|nr:TetR/AcrR family transcriptional regulator [Kribbella shirazensis]NIK58449.1 AcrR family transcriptional regulator [Kribbella shirazensis]
MTNALTGRGAARRDDVLAVARELLVDEGLDQFVLRRIAARAGMKLGNLQYYFATRDDLLEQVIRAEFEHDVQAIRRATTIDGLKDAALALVRHWTTGGGAIFVTMTMLAYHHERFRRLNHEIYETFYRDLGTLIRRVAPGLDEQEIRMRARLITSVLDGVALQLNAGARNRRALTTRAADLVATVALPD